jgi:hypothetical protein
MKVQAKGLYVHLSSAEDGELEQGGLFNGSRGSPNRLASVILTHGATLSGGWMLVKVNLYFFNKFASLALDERYSR